MPNSSFSKLPAPPEFGAHHLHRPIKNDNMVKSPFCLLRGLQLMHLYPKPYRPTPYTLTPDPKRHSGATKHATAAASQQCTVGVQPAHA